MSNFSSPPWLSSSSRNVKGRVVNPDWTALPFDLLLSIAKHLPTRTDILHFRAVCLPFFFAVPSPPKIPFPTSKLSTSRPIIGPLRKSRSNFILSYSTVFAIQPLHKTIYSQKTTKTWLVRFTELSSGLFRVEDPLCPGLFEGLRLPKVLDTWKYRVTEITRVYTIEVDSPERRSGFFNNVIVSPCLGNKDEFSAMAIHREGKIFMWKIINKEWVQEERDFDSYDSRFEYVVYHDRKFYAMGETGLTICVDARSLSVTHVMAPPQNLNLGTRHLVKSPNDLFLVVKYVNAWVDVVVFKMNFQTYKWVKVRDELDERVLFAGNDCSFSLSTREFGGCKPNSVYFVNGYCTGDNDYYPGMDTGIFDLTTSYEDSIMEFPGCSSLFWPPPPWLKAAI